MKRGMISFVSTKTIAALVMVGLVAACSNGASTDTTAGAETTSTSEPSTTVTTGAPTTTEAETTTTTGAETTTTTEQGPEWAALPVVTSTLGVVGWWDGSAWVDDLSGLTIPVTGGEAYRWVDLAGEQIVTGGSAGPTCEPLDIPGITLDPTPDEPWPGPYGVGVSAAWDPVPRPVEIIGGVPAAYIEAVDSWLVSRGLVGAEISIDQLVRTDIEGDGDDEVIVVASNISEFMFAEPGNYSVVLYRTVIEEELQTAILFSQVVVDQDDADSLMYVDRRSVGAVADLNGDGKTEIALTGVYHEGSWIDVIEYVNDDLGPMVVMSVGCGS